MPCNIQSLSVIDTVAWVGVASCTPVSLLVIQTVKKFVFSVTMSSITVTLKQVESFCLFPEVNING